MKKFVLLGIVVSAFFFACSKKSDDTTPTSDPPTSTEKYDGNGLTAAVTVNHGTVVKGDIPVPSTAAGTPVLSGNMSTRPVTTIAGKLVSLPIEFATGSTTRIKGAYVQFKGASSYFNIDFGKPAGARKAADKYNLSREGYADSLITIKLPADFTGDTVKLKVAVYDSSSHVSKPVDVAVVIVTPATDNTAKELAGKWTMVRRSSSDSIWENVAPETDSAWLDCNNGKLVILPKATATAYRGVVHYYEPLEYTLTLNTDGTGVEVQRYKVQNLITDSSSCKMPYYRNDTYGSTAKLNWAYDSIKKIVYVIYDHSDTGSSAPFVTVPATYKDGKLTLGEVHDNKEEYVKK